MGDQTIKQKSIEKKRITLQEFDLQAPNKRGLASHSHERHGFTRQGINGRR